MATDEDLNPVSEVVNADWQFDVVRTYVLGVEILDTRLSDAEFRLLALLRMRASGGRNNFVSYETLAQDLDSSERTIKRTMEGLKSKGYVTCQSRGFGKSPKKTITSMTERYAPDVLTMSRKQMLGSERTDDLLRRLHCLDSVDEHPLVPNLSPHGIIEENPSHKGQICPPVGDKNGTSEVTNLAPEINQVKKIENQGDAVRSAHRDSPSANPCVEISEDQNRSREESTTVVLPTQDKPRDIPSDDDREELARRIQAGAWQNAVERSRVQSAKRLERREQRDLDGTTEANRLARDEAKRNRVTAKSFYDWMWQEFEIFFPDAPRSLKKDVTPKELGQIKRMIEAYEKELDVIKELWTHVCEHWDEVSSTLKIRGEFPTVAMFLGYRKQLMATFTPTKASKAAPKIGSKIGEW